MCSMFAIKHTCSFLCSFCCTHKRGLRGSSLPACVRLCACQCPRNHLLGSRRPLRACVNPKRNHMHASTCAGVRALQKHANITCVPNIEFQSMCASTQHVHLVDVSPGTRTYRKEAHNHRVGRTEICTCTPRECGACFRRTRWGALSVRESSCQNHCTHARICP